MGANNNLAEQLISLSRESFTGILTVESQDGKQNWKIFFYLGKYLWSEGSYHQNRSWRRNFNHYCPGINTENIVLRQQPEIESDNYYLLNILLQRKVVRRKQTKDLLDNYSQEILFDLLQKEYNDLLHYDVRSTSAHYLLKAGFNLSLAFINLEQILFQSQTAWSAWGAKGLASCSPHHAPLLRKNKNLEQLLPDIIFSNMSRLLNGKNTLRDLSFKMQKNVLDLTCGIVPYFFKGYLRFLEIPDLPKQHHQSEYKSNRK